MRFDGTPRTAVSAERHLRRRKELLAAARYPDARTDRRVCGRQYVAADNASDDVFERFADFPTPRLLDTVISGAARSSGVELMTGTTHYDPPAIISSPIGRR